jgi:transposase
MEAGVVTDRILSDDLWMDVAPLLPGKAGDPGCHGRDNRLFLEAVFWIARTGAPWRDLPPEFGKWYTTYTRYHRWEKKGIWPKVVSALNESGARDLLYDRDGVRWGVPAADAEPKKEQPAGKAAAA